MSKKIRVGIFRTVYPIYSEVFITKQIKSCKNIEPVVICRDNISEVHGIKLVSVNGKFSRLIFTLVGYSKELFSNKIVNDIELLHAHFVQDAALILSLSYVLDKPMVVTCHGSDVTTTDYGLILNKRITDFRYLILRKMLKKKVTTFIVVSDFIRDLMVKKGFPKDKIVKHYIGVDTQLFVPGKEKKSGSKKSIISIARHTDVKGIDILLSAFSKVLEYYPDLSLIQVGDGTLTSDLRKQCVDLGIDGNVFFKGALEQVEIVKLMQESSALVLSSRKSKSGAEEAFGLALVEASACGIPVIGTRVGGIPEAVIDGETGFVVESENVEELASAIIKIINDDSQARLMGARGRDMVLNRFNIAEQSIKLEELYLNIINNHTLG
ncbi:glycosyltransferase [Amphritea balenae]|uniref:Glycosyltransferase n=1 Tax=Amphritea balenae TaxID=452629 RepID=A0A3P1SSM0_9GAMM|nr:glycosyltransferase [Amphritea balenae]RRD00197.1 glycosyltransferase [Amphritea balenae]GGK77492.1 glucosyltransferase [Amphritea balenae]